MVSEAARQVVPAELDADGWIELERCPICDSPNRTPFETHGENDEQVVYLLCGNCGAVYQSPRMSGAALERYYRSEYVSDHQGAQWVSEKELQMQRGRASHLLELLAPHVQRIDRHLDIGSSAGMLMQAVRDTYGCESIGIEPADVYRQFAAASGLRSYPSLADLAAAQSGRFDLISLSHVLEHLPEPVGYLDDLRQNWLEPGGWLLVEVPNLFGHYSLERPHLFCFHRASLRHTLAAAGYRSAQLRAHGRPRSKIIPLYLTVLARPAAVRMRARSGSFAVRLRRRLGMAWHRFATKQLTRWAWPPPEDMVSDEGTGR